MHKSRKQVRNVIAFYYEAKVRFLLPTSHPFGEVLKRHNFHEYLIRGCFIITDKYGIQATTFDERQKNKQESIIRLILVGNEYQKDTNNPHFTPNRIETFAKRFQEIFQG